MAFFDFSNSRKQYEEEEKLRQQQAIQRIRNYSGTNPDQLRSPGANPARARFERDREQVRLMDDRSGIEKAAQAVGGAARTVGDFAGGMIEGISEPFAEAGGDLLARYRKDGFSAPTESREEIKVIRGKKIAGFDKLPKDLQAEVRNKITDIHMPSSSKTLLINLVKAGAPPEQIKNAILDGEEEKVENTKRGGAQVTEVGATFLGGKGFKKAFDETGWMGAAKAGGELFSIGGLGGAAYTVRNDPNASVKDIATNALVSGGTTVAFSGFASGAGALNRRMNRPGPITDEARMLPEHATIVDKSRMLGTGEEGLVRRLNQIDEELAPIARGEAPIATPGKAPRKAEGVTDVTRTGGTEGITETGRVRQLAAERNSIVKEIEAINGQTPGADPKHIRRLREIDNKIAQAQQKGGLDAKSARELMRERKAVLNAIENPDGAPIAEKAATVSSKAVDEGGTAKAINKKLAVTDYTGRLSDTITSFFKALEGLAEESGGGEILAGVYEKVIRGIADRDEVQTVLAKNLNANLGLSNKAKRKMGTEVGDILREVPDGVLNNESAESIARRIGKNVKAVEAAKTVRRHFTELLDKVNEERALQGKDPIPYRSEYAPQWQTSTRTSGASSSSALPDEKFNPFAQKRSGKDGDFERNVFKVMDQYHRYAANEMYLNPAITHLRGISKQLRAQGNTGGADWLDNYIKVGLTKTQVASFDEGAKIFHGTRKQRVLQRVAMARSLSGLAGNIKWMLFTQPQTIFSVTPGKFGVKNTVAGMFDYVTNPKVREEISQLPIYRMKRVGSVGTTSGGQLDRVASSVLKTRREFYNDFINIPADFMEKTLDGMSAAAARRSGMGYVKSGKMTKQGLQTYMNHGIEVTQSVYSAEMRPEVLQNLTARTLFPFQSYSVEMWRHVRNLSEGKGAGFTNTPTRRAVQATTMITGIILGNELQKMATGRNIASPGSVVPFAGEFVNKGVDAVAGTDFGQSSTAGLTAFERDIQTLTDAVKTYTEDGDYSKMRKAVTTWGMGLSGIGGASTVNRLADTAEAYWQEQIDFGKQRLPFDRSVANVAHSAFSGPTSTKAGQQAAKEMKSPVGGFTDEKVAKEVGGELKAVDYDPRPPKNTMSVDGEEKELTPEVHAEYKRLYFKGLQNGLPRVINHPEYKKLSAEEKKKKLMSARDLISRHAKEQLMKQGPR